MLFRNSPINPATRSVAAVVIMAVGGVIVAIGQLPSIIVGAIVIVTGLTLLVQTTYSNLRNRQGSADRYDLAELKRVHTEIETRSLEPSVESDTDEMIYCHRCGCSMSRAYSICPDCGGALGK